VAKAPAPVLSLRPCRARDLYHPHVVDALLRDGWVITHDPLVLRFGAKDLFIDLGAERVLAAEKAGRKIAIEVKSFVGPSEVRELELALGQFVLYGEALALEQPERTLYIAVRSKVYRDLFEEPPGSVLLSHGRLRLLVFDPDRREIVRWIP
jgi:hypothetical protein